MSATNQPVNAQWNMKPAMLLATICLLVGMSAGWLIRGWGSPKLAETANGAASAATTAPNAASSAADPARLKSAADAQAAPLLEQLKANPNNADLLAAIGNLYYDAQQYAIAVDYYGRALKIKPTDASVRTDEGTAYWYMGNADSAIAEFDQALTYAPTNANTLFNRGLVKWHGKNDLAGAAADWKKLLATNPSYEARDKVEQMLAEVEKQAGSPAK